MIPNKVYDPLKLFVQIRNDQTNKNNCLFSDPNFDKKYKLEMHEEKREC